MTEHKPSRPAYLSRFLALVVAAGGDYEPYDYRRPSGQVQGHRFRPKGTARGQVLLAHGAGNNGLYSHKTLVVRLVAAGYCVHTFDLDGHGTTSTTTIAAASLAGMMQDAASGAGLQPNQWHAIGHSLGGSLLLRALQEEEIQPRSLTLISTPVKAAWSVLAAPWEVGSVLAPAFFALRETYGLWGMLPAFGPFKRSSYPVRIARGAKPGSLVAIIRSLLLSLSIDKLAISPSAHRTAFLMIYGTLDWIVPPVQGRALAEQLGGRFVQIPRATHMTTVLRDATSDAVLQFLQEVSP